MESLLKIKELVEKMSIDTQKVVQKGNKSASIRARKNAQAVKHLIQSYRKDILDEIRKYDTHDSQ
jgi:hypothetical protein